ncbi:MAG: inorganic diphosphatase [Myxococcota bacterium]
MLPFALGETVEVLVEVPRFSFVKRRPNGDVHFVSPIPTLYNYGSVVGTLAPDGDPLDALLIGPRAPVGTRLRSRLQAVVDFVDHSLPDPKLVLAPAPLNRAARWQLEAFFRVYARAKLILDPGPGHTRYNGLILR